MRIADVIAAVERAGRAAVVLVAEAKGSAPREAGAAMLVTERETRGTVGGGTVEHRAVALAREMLAGTAAAGVVQDFPLGPGLDQFGPTDNYSALRDSTKAILSFMMLLGRLELYSVLVMFHPRIWKS